RFTHRPSETGAVAMALLGAVGGQAPATNFTNANLKNAIAKVANDLRANNGAALVVCGSNDPNIQAVVAAINSAIGAPVEAGVSINTRQGIDANMIALVDQMLAGQVGALLIYGANPVYDYFDAERFKQGMARVKLAISFNEKLDETTDLCQFVIPNHHFLESWGDAEPRTSFVSFIQPTIFPLFKTRPFQTSLLKWAGNNTEYENYFRGYWSGRLGSQAAFDKVLQDGILANAPGTSPAATTGGTPTPIGDATTALSTQRSNAGTEVVLYTNIAMLSGKQSGNPWLLELPDPVTRATWDNYAMISMKIADELRINYKNSDYEYYPEKPVIEITANGKKVSLPAMVIPGMDPDTIAVAVGYGRGEKFSKATQGVGKNVFPLTRRTGNNFTYFSDAAVTLSGEMHKVAQVQIHNSYEGRTEVVKETSLASFKLHPNAYKEWREELHKDYAPQSGDYRKEATLYGDYVYPGIKWGMSIDMNLCIGCHACVVACHAENNVSVVGKNEVLRYHDMHWLRIDRYFVSDKEHPEQLKAVVFQPMLCQHCDNAPCENVCPVGATMHSSEGINQMAYNRCIGTRYCANNCPYKVRRFNWADYIGADSFKDNQNFEGVGKLNDVVHQMNNDLTRMVLNPDVVTRSRGVMEKCTFCVQRTQQTKLTAKMENRPIGGDEVQTACSQACPTNAITFGNVNDQSSTVSKIRKGNPQRLFYV
ncbi:MAG: 4Fe-4S dicluster domain-containing protein, partial [Flavisolibacter sp.]|nr:4Fe-4S dicluster domain-containing protein [Flavisolibacter sp.]